MLETKKNNNSFRGAHKGVARSEETKQKIKNALINKEYICDICGKKGINSVMFRWHFNNCKKRLS